jgi:hypothetical protein
MHDAPLPHVTPQAPQFWAVFRAVHTPLQRPSPGGQQVLCVHWSVPVHALPHAPQAAAELVRSKQPGVPASAPHCTTGAPLSRPASNGHVNEHVAFTQVVIAPTLPPDGAMHPLPHAPQLFGSVVMSTHVPQHGVRPPVHAPVHTPQLHVLGGGHFLPHAPQLFGSLVVSASHSSDPVSGFPVDVSVVASTGPVPSVDASEEASDGFCS